MSLFRNVWFPQSKESPICLIWTPNFPAWIPSVSLHKLFSSLGMNKLYYTFIHFTPCPTESAIPILLFLAESFPMHHPRPYPIDQTWTHGKHVNCKVRTMLKSLQFWSLDALAVGNSTASPVFQNLFILLVLSDYILDERQRWTLRFSPEYQQKTGKYVLWIHPLSPWAETIYIKTVVVQGKYSREGKDWEVCHIIDTYLLTQSHTSFWFLQA